MLEDNTMNAKTANGFKTKPERERENMKSTGPSRPSRTFRSGHPASIHDGQPYNLVSYYITWLNVRARHWEPSERPYRRTRHIWETDSPRCIYIRINFRVEWQLDAATISYVHHTDRQTIYLHYWDRQWNIVRRPASRAASVMDLPSHSLHISIAQLYAVRCCCRVCLSSTCWCCVKTTRYL